MGSLKQIALSILAKWIELVEKASIAVLLLVFVLALLAIQYTKNNLGMNTSTKDMLSAELTWRKLDLEYERHFPQYDNNIVIVVEADTPDQAQDAAFLLYENLLLENDIFHRVYYPKALPVFKESGLLFLEMDALQDLADQLARIQPFLARLTQDPSLPGLFNLLSTAIDAMEQGEDIDIHPILVQINKAIEAQLTDSPYRVSWRGLMSAEDNTGDSYREFILLQPKLDYRHLLPASRAIKKTHDIYKELNIETSPGAAIHLTGTVVLSHEELISVTKGTSVALIAALCMVTIILLFGLGSVKLMLATIISLITGLILTAAFATLSVGELNLISVAFAVLYIGLGVDFAIHYCLRYRQYIQDGAGNTLALTGSSVNIGSSLMLCAASTAIGFFAFIPTNYVGVAELGWIAGCGMFISLLVTLTVIPALLSLFPLRERKPQTPSPKWHKTMIALPENQSMRIIAVTATLVVISAFSLTQIRFDHNTLNLQDQNNPSVKTFRALLADKAISPWKAVMLAEGQQEAKRYKQLFSDSELVHHVISIDDFIPKAQDKKLALIDEMSLLLGDFAMPAAREDIAMSERESALLDFQRKLQTTQLILTGGVFQKLNENLSILLNEKNPSEKSANLAKLETAILASLPGRLASLGDALGAEMITMDNLPAALKTRWLSEDGFYRLEIYPTKDMQNNTHLREFVREIKAISPRVTGSPVISLEASDAVAAAFKQAFLYAFIVITLMLYVLFTHKSDVLLVLLPLLAAAIITGGVSVLLDMPLNFANVIALPLLLGMGVDSGIHIIHRYRTDLADGHRLLASSSARAVIVSALTTMGGIGNLAISPHAGTASMGVLLTMGIGVTSLCMLVLLPALLEGGCNNERQPEDAGA